MSAKTQKRRTQIYLDPFQYRGLRVLSRQQHTTTSALIRTAVQNYLERLNAPAGLGDHPFLQMIDLGQSETSFSGSIDHDQALYRGKRPL